MDEGTRGERDRLAAAVVLAERGAGRWVAAVDDDGAMWAVATSHGRLVRPSSSGWPCITSDAGFAVYLSRREVERLQQTAPAGVPIVAGQEASLRCAADAR